MLEIFHLKQYLQCGFIAEITLKLLRICNNINRYMQMKITHSIHFFIAVDESSDEKFIIIGCHGYCTLHIIVALCTC